MIQTQPVGQPHHRRDRRLVALTVLVLAALVVAILKPWASVPPRDLALASPPPPSPIATSPPPSAVPAGVYTNYSTSLFGDRPHAPMYELWPTGYLTSYGFSRVLDYQPTPIPRSGTDATNMFDLGTMATTVALGINHPADVITRAFRLWSMTPGRPPARVYITALPSPFGSATFNVIGIPDVRAPDRLVNWPPSVYRLDMLATAAATGVDDRIISLTLRVDPDPTALPSPGDTPTSPSAERPDLPTLLAKAAPNSLLAIGGDTVQAHDLQRGSPGQGTCDVVDTWLAEIGSGTRCAPVPVGRIVALAFDGGPTAVIVSAGLRRIDPTSSTVGVTDLTLAPGLAVVSTTDGQVLPEGTYRLDVATADGQHRAWYFEVEPGGSAGP